MASELVFTSAERGIKPRTSGFCTVAMTQGLPINLCERLESLSGYRHQFPSYDPQAQYNPVNFSYYRFIIGGNICPVLSRVANYGVDYTGRSNKLAHHVVLQEAEMAPAGPAAIARSPDTFVTEWNSEPRLSEPVPIEVPRQPARIAKAWARLTGDAGWAGAVADYTLKSDSAVVAILYQPGPTQPPLLELIDEALALIPPTKRWEITFSTYLTDMPTGTTCRWRCVVLESAEWEKVRRNNLLLVIDTTSSTFDAPAAGPLVDAARSGADPYADCYEGFHKVDNSVRPEMHDEFFPPPIEKGWQEYELAETPNVSTGRQQTLLTPCCVETEIEPPKSKLHIIIAVGILVIGLSLVAFFYWADLMKLMPPSGAQPNDIKPAPAVITQAIQDRPK